MTALDGLALLRPWWLLAAPAALLLGLAASRRVAGLAAWEKAVDPGLMRALERLGWVVPGGGRGVWLVPLLAVILALALSGPARESRDGAAFRNLDGLVLVVDLSRSMAEGGRLDEALTAARVVARRAGSRPAALVVYAGDAYLASAFTTDRDALGALVAALDGQTVPDEGSRPERALSLARGLMEQARIVRGDVVLISDGGGVGPAALRAASALDERGVRVSTLFTPQAGAPIGAPPAERSAAEALARVGGGFTADVLDPLAFADAVSGRRAERVADSELSLLLWTDYGRWLLLGALLPALALFRRRA